MLPLRHDMVFALMNSQHLWLSTLDQASQNPIIVEGNTQDPMLTEDLWAIDSC